MGAARFKIHSKMADPRILPVSVNANGSLAIGNRYVTSEKTSTGTYSISLKKSFQQKMFAYATPRADGLARHFVRIPSSQLTAREVVVKTTSFADALADAPFDLFLIGSDGRAPVFGCVPQLMFASLVKPRLLSFYFKGATSEQTFGSNDGSFVKTGTGLYTLNLAQPFSQTPYVIATTNAGNRHVEIATKSNKQITFQVVSDSAVAADAEIYVMIIGSDTPRIFGGGVSKYLVKTTYPWMFMNPFEWDGANQSMLRGEAYISGDRVGAGDYDFTFEKKNPKIGFGFASASDNSGPLGVLDRALTGFTVQGEATNDKIYGLDVSFRRGRDQI